MTLTLTLGLSLALWGTLVGLDLVSLPQMMIARPLVAGTVAGWILGDPVAGLRAGVVMELFALDVLAVGAVRYPDYGPSTVAAAVVAASGPWPTTLGPAIFVGLVTAWLGGLSLQVVRRANADTVQSRSAALAAGETRAIRSLHYLGIARDALRSLALTLVGLGLAFGFLGLGRLAPRASVDTAVAVGVGLAATLGGALRSAGPGPRRRWLIGGLMLGTALAVFR